MATTIITKYGSGAPTASDVVRGELAVDTENKRLYTEDSGGSVVELGTNPAANVTFGDNVKAIFGAGSDLQIGHDGSVSFITDSGTGDLYIQGSSAIRLTNPAGNESFAVFNDNGAASLYYDNGVSLSTTSTGIDVTGTVTADGLTVDGNATISVSDNSDNLTLISTDTDANAGPNLLFKRDNNSAAGDDLMGSIVFQGEDAGNNLTDYVAFKTQIQDPTGGSEDGRLKIELMSGGTSRSLLDASGSNAIVFNEDGQALNFRVESSGNANMLFVDGTNDRVGIGTTPASELHVKGSTPDLRVENTTASETVSLSLIKTATKGFSINNKEISGTNYLTFNLDTAGAGTDAMVIHPTSGNVGIGGAPSSTLDVGCGVIADPTLRIDSAAGGDPVLLFDTGAASRSSFVDFRDQGTLAGSIIYSHADDHLGFSVASNNRSEVMRIDSSGNVGIGVVPSTWAAAWTALDIGDGTLFSQNNRTTGLGSNIYFTGSAWFPKETGESALYQISQGTHNWYANSSVTSGVSFTPTTKMTLDASGNLLVGKSATTFATEGIVAFSSSDSNGSRINITNDGGETLNLNRNTSDGNLAIFYKDSTAVGSIGTLSGYLTIGDDAGILFNNANPSITPFNVSTNANRDAEIDLGVSNVRWKDLYLSGTANAGSVLKVNSSVDGTEAAPHFQILGASSSYRINMWLDGTAAYMGQDSAFRSLRLYSSAETAGVQLSAGGTSWGTFSDERLKENVEPVENALQSLSGLRTVKYHLKDVDGPEDKKKIGVIAQDLVGVLDEVIDPAFRSDDDTEYMGVRYTELVPVLIKAIQEQQDLIESLTARIAALEGV